jgi:hypothetical protein
MGTLKTTVDGSTSLPGLIMMKRELGIFKKVPGVISGRLRLSELKMKICSKMCLV